ncbi:MAG: glycosyltransferase [Acidihalobacter sp.]
MSRPLTILHTEAATDLGGQERRILREMELLDRERFRPVYVCSPGGKSVPVAQELGIPTYTLRMRNSVDPVAIARLLGILRRERVDLIHTHSSRDAWVAGFAGRLARVPVVRTRHLRTPIGGPFVYHRLADRVIGVSEDVRQYLIGEGVPAAQVINIPTGVDLTRFDPARTDLAEVRAELGIPPQAFLVGIVSVLRHAKGHRFLIEAFARLHAQNPEARLLIVGDGPGWNNLETQVRELGLQDVVTMPGTRRDAPAVLKALDVFVLPSTLEALGTAILEALAMGTPVLASRVGGIPEATGEDAGLLCAVGDVDCLAASLQRLADEPELRRRLSEAGLRRVHELYDQRLMVKRIEALYDELLESRA